MKPEDQPQNNPKFPSTHWTAVFAAGRAGEGGDGSALDKLLRKYQAPLLTHLQWRFRASQDQAEDWLQTFITRKVLERNIIESARPERGRFRTFLMKALDNFVVSEIRRENQGRRKPPGGFVSDTGLAETLPAAAGPATDPADVLWARAVIQQAVSRLRDFYGSRHRADLWGVFSEGFLEPLLNATRPPDMAELARRFGFESADQASHGLLTAKRKFRRFLEQGVAEYAEDEAEIEGELRDLMAILGGD
jgi:RNA polymerase sigma-70 factor (ECF subfamily)